MTLEIRAAVQADVPLVLQFFRELDEWTVQRVTGDALKQLADRFEHS